MKIILTFIIYLLSGTASAERPSNELPMYGGTHNPTIEENKDHSASSARLGWQYYYKGDLNTAIKRFNQSWMFDRKNAEAFWGFGLIMGRRATEENTEINLKESIAHLERAILLSNNNPRIMVDLAFSKTLLGTFIKDNKKPLFQRLFNEAELLFEKAEKLEETYPVLYYNWSVLKFYEGKYSLARSKLNRAKQLGYKADQKS